jgi:hypothetical protein
MGIPATSRKKDPEVIPDADGGDSNAPQDQNLTAETESRVSAENTGKKEVAQAGEEVAPENSILPPQQIDTPAEQPTAADEVRPPHTPTAGTPEDDPDQADKSRAEKTSANESSATRPPAVKSATVSVNGKSGDS